LVEGDAALVGVVEFSSLLSREALEDHSEVGLRLLARDARLEPRHGAEPVVIGLRQPAFRADAALGGHGYGNGRRASGLDAKEFGRRNTDDGERHFFDVYRPADRRGIGAEASFPESVAQYGDRFRRRAGKLVVLGSDHTADSRIHSEYRVVVSSDVLAVDVFGFLADANLGRAIVGYGKDAGGSMALIAKLLVPGIRKVGAVVLIIAAELDQLAGIADRQHLEHDGVDDGEYGGVGADAESERQDRRGGESRAAAQQAETVAEIL
jgi:hypothetical protein